MLIVSARIAVLNTNDSTDCISTSRRIGVLQMATSAVCDATAMVNEKYRKSQYAGGSLAEAAGNRRPWPSGLR